MNITLHTIPIRELVDGFADNNEDGVVGYHGKLNIRPPFQREFVYDDKQKKEVINSIFKGFPLNVMYWVKNEQGTYELLDGQQRTISICLYYINSFFVNVNGSLKGIENLNDEEKAKFLDYPLQIYICENGTDKEQLDWFRIINIAGEKLTNQELRNAVYTGAWITDAKRRFSKTGCVAYKLGQRYMNGTPIRQDYLETVLKWKSGGNIEEYMATHQHDKNADIEWQYFQRIITWVESLFTTYRKEMKGVAWGELYNRFKDDEHTATDLENEVSRLMMDDDVTNKKGIYDYVLSKNESKLSIRGFSNTMKRQAYERQTKAAKKKGVSNCPLCAAHKGGENSTKIWSLEEMEADHIKPWSKGGETKAENCQMLCKRCNATKSDH